MAYFSCLPCTDQETAESAIASLIKYLPLPYASDKAAWLRSALYWLDVLDNSPATNQQVFAQAVLLADSLARHSNLSLPVAFKTFTDVMPQLLSYADTLQPALDQEVVA